ALLIAPKQVVKGGAELVDRRSGGRRGLAWRGLAWRGPGDASWQRRGAARRCGYGCGYGCGGGGGGGCAGARAGHHPASSRAFAGAMPPVIKKHLIRCRTIPLWRLAPPSAEPATTAPTPSYNATIRRPMRHATNAQLLCRSGPSLTPH